MTSSKYGKIIAIATTVCIIALGLAFIICALHLYLTGGDQPYSRESVGSYLIILAAPSFITVALAICGFIYAYVSKTKDNDSPPRTNCELLDSFASRYVFDSFDEETKMAVRKIRKKRGIIDLVASEITAFCLVFILDYLIFIADFTTETLNADIISALAVVLPLAAVAIAIHIPRMFMAEKSAAEELSLLKASIKEHGAPMLANKTDKTKKIDSVAVTRYVILGVAVIFVVIGILNGGIADVLGKAVRICTECIGLG